MKTKAKLIELETNGVIVDVIYDYTEAEPMVLNYGDGSGYPGSPASVDIYRVEVDYIDITDLLADYVLEDLEQQILEYYEQ